MCGSCMTMDISLNAESPILVIVISRVTSFPVSVVVTSERLYWISSALPDAFAAVEMVNKDATQKMRNHGLNDFIKIPPEISKK